MPNKKGISPSTSSFVWGFLPFAAGVRVLTMLAILSAASIRAQDAQSAIGTLGTALVLVQASVSVRGERK